MANTNVTLLWRCKTPDGWKRFPALYAKNGRPRTGWVTAHGRDIEYPFGRFQLRYYDGNKQLYKDAGENPTDAVHSRDQMARKLMAKAAASAAGLKIADEVPNRKTLLTAFDDFIDDVKARGKNEAAEVYSLSVRAFFEAVGKSYVDEIGREDLVRFQRRMREDGYSDRTIHNRHANVCTFLAWVGIDVKKISPGRPQYEKTVPEVYTLDQMTAFFASINDPKITITFEIMLKCGLREQEAMYLEWQSIDFTSGKLRVRANSRYGFKVKDKEERDVPIETALLAHLKAMRKKDSNSRLVTGTKTDHPNTHMLRTLKRLVNRAKLQCKVCESCCRDANPECERWFLHKFRATYVTMLLRAGMDLRTVMKYSGHSDLESVQRYLSPADDESARGVVNSVRWL